MGKSTYSYSPYPFKAVIGRFAPRFAGLSQQDSQEFVSFLLDGSVSLSLCLSRFPIYFLIIIIECIPVVIVVDCMRT